MHRNSWTISAIALLACACGNNDGKSSTERVATATAAETAPAYYEAFRAGDENTDQRTAGPDAHSSLVGADMPDSSVQDDDFAAHVAAPAIKAGARLFFSLGECFSGGFIDDLAPLGGTQSVLASARHTETASYGDETPQGVNIDFTDAFLRALGDGKTPGEQVARATAALDPFGPNPTAKRGEEEMGSEHAQYFATGGGDQLRPADHTKHGLAVLWAGLPAERDGAQMAQMIDQLVTMGFTRDRIWLFYGAGKAEPNHPIVTKHIAAKAQAIHLRSATRKQLVGLFDAKFVSHHGRTPDFVFFYVGDHGGLDGEAEAKGGFLGLDALVATRLDQIAPAGNAPQAARAHARTLVGEGDMATFE
jgi:hypothetical protein